MSMKNTVETPEEREAFWDSLEKESKKPDPKPDEPYDWVFGGIKMTVNPGDPGYTRPLIR
jgi:hypothetical protein